MEKQFDRKTVFQVVANKIISQVQYVSREFILALDGQMLSSSSGFGCSKDLVGDKIVGVENDFNPTSDVRLAVVVETYVNISQTYIHCHEFVSRHDHSPFAVGYNFLQFSYITVTLFCQFHHYASNAGGINDNRCKRIKLVVSRCPSAMSEDA